MEQNEQPQEQLVLPADTVITEVDAIPEGQVVYTGEVDASQVNLPKSEEQINAELEQVGLKVPAVASPSTEPEIAALMERVADTHRVKVYQDEAQDYWEVYLIHVSSLPKHSTVVTLRNVMGDGNTYGKHVRIQGTKAEVLEACSKWQ